MITEPLVKATLTSCEGRREEKEEQHAKCNSFRLSHVCQVIDVKK